MNEVPFEWNSNTNPILDLPRYKIEVVVLNSKNLINLSLLNNYKNKWKGLSTH